MRKLRRSFKSLSGARVFSTSIGRVILLLFLLVVHLIPFDSFLLDKYSSCSSSEEVISVQQEYLKVSENTSTETLLLDSDIPISFRNVVKKKKNQVIVAIETSNFEKLSIAFEVAGLGIHFPS